MVSLSAVWTCCLASTPSPRPSPLFPFEVRVGCTGTSATLRRARARGRARTFARGRGGKAGRPGERPPRPARRVRARKWKIGLLGRAQNGRTATMFCASPWRLPRALVVRVERVEEGRVVAGRVQVAARRRGNVAVDQVVPLLVLQDHKLRRETGGGKREGKR